MPISKKQKKEAIPDTREMRNIRTAPDPEKYTFNNHTGLWHKVFLSINTPVIIINKDLQIIAHNESAFKVFGKGMDSISGLKCSDIMHTEQNVLESCQVYQQIQDNNFSPLSYEIELNNGSFVVNASPFYDEDASAYYYILVLNDVTALKTIRSALRKSKEQYLNVLESLNDALHLVDKNLVMIYANKKLRSWNRKFGFNDKVEGKLLTAIYPFLGDDVIREYEEVFLHGKRIVTEEENLLNSGMVVTETLKIPLKSDGRVIQVVTVMRDISDQQATKDKLLNANRKLKLLKDGLEDKINQAVKEIDEKESLLIRESRKASLGEVIGNIAHQWRQPLSGLAGIIQNLEESYYHKELDEDSFNIEIQHAMTIIQQMSDVIDDFRYFFKSGGNKKAFSLKEVINRSLQILESRLKQYGAEVKNDIREDIIVKGLPNEFAQVIINILNNAIDAFKESRNEHLKIYISQKKQQKTVELIIGNNAGAIRKEDQEKIFEPYYTTKRDGTGIGLYMSKTIIEDHMGGELTIRNTENGVEFIINI